MQAVQIFAHGDPSVLQVVDIPRPAPQAGEVLARVLAVSLNHLDLWTRRGMPGFKVGFPRILGCDGVGEVVELGEGVAAARADLRVGTRVLLEPGYSSGTSAHDLAGNDHLSDDYGVRGEHGDGYACEFVALPARFMPDRAGRIDEFTEEVQRWFAHDHRVKSHSGRVEAVMPAQNEKMRR